MSTVGLRELKNRLAEYIREVRAGGAVAVTDRGTVVAEIVPPGEACVRIAETPGLKQNQTRCNGFREITCGFSWSQSRMRFSCSYHSKSGFARAALAAKGEVTLGARNNPDAYPELPRLLRRGRAWELLDEERGER